MRLIFTMAMGALMTGTGAANVVELSEFAGDQFEDFNSYPGGLGGHAALDIFDGDVTLRKGEGGSVKIEISSSRGGDLVLPRSNPVFAGQFGVMEWVFHRPIVEFGGYFENNSRFDDLVIEFFDSQDQSIATVSADAPADAQTWTWNGWSSSTPVHRITTAGNDVDFLNGFVWFEDMRISYAVPEPTWGPLALILLSSCLGRRRALARQKT